MNGGRAHTMLHFTCHSLIHILIYKSESSHCCIALLVHHQCSEATSFTHGYNLSFISLVSSHLVSSQMSSRLSTSVSSLWRCWVVGLVCLHHSSCSFIAHMFACAFVCVCVCCVHSWHFWIFIIILLYACFTVLCVFWYISSVLKTLNFIHLVS